MQTIIGSWTIRVVREEQGTYTYTWTVTSPRLERSSSGHVSQTAAYVDALRFIVLEQEREVRRLKGK